MTAERDIGIIVFAKAPEPGFAKTRLAPALGAGGAAVLAARLARRTLDIATRSAVGPVTLACAPDTTHPFFELCRRRHGVTLVAQGEGDLGARMHRALVATLTRHAGAVLIGTDVPGLAAADLAQAASALHDGAEVVLGPATDGGYWLIGVGRGEPALFEGVAWSTAAVLAQTRARVAALGWRDVLLAERADVDRPEDLPALLADPDAADLVADLMRAPSR